MTILIPVGRSRSVQVVLQLPRRSSPLLTRLLSTKSHPRVAPSQPARALPHRAQCSSTTPSAPFQLLQARSLSSSVAVEDAAPAAAGRPKAHSGRTTTGRKTAGAKKTTAKPEKKAKPKKKAAAKAKPRKKKELSEAGKKRKEAAERSELKKQALLRGAPKALPDNTWTVFFVENGPKKGEALDKSGSRAKAAAEEYRNIGPAERERLNNIANQNKAANEAAYKQWVQSHTPLQIKQANHARNLLRQEAKKNGLKATSFPHIKDDRLVKQPLNQFSLFLKDRFDSGDLKGLSLADASKAVGREWNDLSPAEKEAYNERFAAERSRYQEEYKAVYGIESPSSAPSSPASASS